MIARELVRILVACAASGVACAANTVTPEIARWSYERAKEQLVKLDD